MSDPIFMLNDNCFLEIFKHLSLHDLANFKKCYESLGAIVDMIFTKKTRGTLSFYRDHKIEKALRIIEQFGPSVNDLRFEYGSLNGTTWNQIFSVVSCNENLKHFSLIGDTIGLIQRADVLLIANILRKIETLKLVNWNKDIHLPYDFIEILSCCENVRDVTLVSLSGVNVPTTIFQTNKNLQTLQWFGQMNGSDLKTIVDNLLHTRLEKLYLQSTKLSHNENQSLVHLHRLNHLKSLSIDCNHLDIGPFLLKLGSYNSLNDLNLCNARLDENIIATLGRMISLKTLKLDSNCILATRSHFEPALVLCANKNFGSIQLLCYEGAFDTANYLRIVEKRKALAAEKCLHLTVTHVVYTASFLNVSNELLEANKQTIKLIDENDVGLNIIVRSRIYHN